MTQPIHSAVLVPQKTCWRIERAERYALVIDAESYFRAVKDAISQARHTVYLIGWDFDTRIELEPVEKTLPGPDKLGPFLRQFARDNPDVDIHVLKWDIGLVQALGRGTTPLAMLGWMTGNRIRFKLDGAHPRGATHHQKIVVVDDALAFCGGIDIMVDRWDTRAHRDDDPNRRQPDGKPHGPWHDATSAVDGDVARALGDLARGRWKRATGEDLVAPPRGSTIWPESLTAPFTDVDVAIARTVPAFKDKAATREIEALYLAAIAQARDTIYCESQYFASRRIAEALAQRLAEEDGPEVIIVNPESADGFLEAATMDSARARLLKLIGEADRFDRFRIYTPVTEGRQPIYVHAKVLVVDDRLLRVGSSNLNNRSMGFDTECDLAIEATPGCREETTLRERIIDVRDDLLAEHLACGTDDIGRAMREHDGSLIAAVDSLRGDGRSLVPYVPCGINAAEAVLAENDLLDPERPPSLTKKFLGKTGLSKLW